MPLVTVLCCTVLVHINNDDVRAAAAQVIKLLDACYECHLEAGNVEAQSLPGMIQGFNLSPIL